MGLNAVGTDAADAVLVPSWLGGGGADTVAQGEEEGVWVAAGEALPDCASEAVLLGAGEALLDAAAEGEGDPASNDPSALLEPT